MSFVNSKLVAKLRDAGVTVKGVAGWENRSRPGTFDPKGVLNHHTASDNDSEKYMNWLAKEGRSDLPAPLCQGAIAQDGTLWMIAGGRANHAGKTNGRGFTTKNGDGNTQLVGFEWCYSGTKTPPKKMVDAAVLINAVILNELGVPASHALGHKETSVTGKIDPGKVDMDDFRKKVEAKMKELKGGGKKSAPAKKASAKKAASKTKNRGEINFDAAVAAARSPRRFPTVTRRIQEALVEEGFGKFIPNGVYGPQTTEAYAKFQRSLGYKGADADGRPGPASLKKLGFKDK